MEDKIRNIPYPYFKFSDVIDQKAQRFCRSYLRGPLYRLRDITEPFLSELYSLNKDEDKIQYVGYLINSITESVSEHVKTCTTIHCQVEPSSQEILYFLYGKLEESGLTVDAESFTKEEINENNLLLNEINYKLDEVKVGEHILHDDIQDIDDKIDSLKSDIKELKELYALGKKKWYRILVGTIAEKAADKTMEEVVKAILPHVIKLLPAAFQVYLEIKK